MRDSLLESLMFLKSNHNLLLKFDAAGYQKTSRLSVTLPVFTMDSFGFVNSARGQYFDTS